MIYQGRSLPPSRPTFFTEVEVIDLTLKVLHLAELLHERNIVHTNLCPEEIFLRDEDINQMCFLSLYHASWDAGKVLNLPGMKSLAETINKYDTRSRSCDFISPEQVKLGE